MMSSILSGKTLNLTHYWKNWVAKTIKPLTIVLTVFAVSLNSPSPASGQTSRHIVSGEITIADAYFGTPGDLCIGSSKKGYQDIMRGVSIVVKDGKGVIIASVNTPPGKNVDTGLEKYGTRSYVMCEISIPEFEVPDSDFYVFEFGRRGTITKSRQEMQDSKWKLQLKLGGY